MDMVFPVTIIVIILLFVRSSSGIYDTITPPDKDLYQLGSLTYLMFNHLTATFDVARSICKEKGGDLAKIDSQEAMDVLIQTVRKKYSYDDFFKDEYYLGVYQPSWGVYHWVSDCSTATYDVVTNHQSSSDRCILMKKENDLVSTVSCSDTEKNFLCEIYNSEPCPYASRLTGILSTQDYSWYNSTSCNAVCDVNTHCWGTVQRTYSPKCSLLVDNGPSSNSFNVMAKSCIDVTTTGISQYNVASTITDHGCTVPVASTSTTYPTYPAASDPAICPTVTISQPPVTVHVPTTVDRTVDRTVTVSQPPVTVPVTVDRTVDRTVTVSHPPVSVPVTVNHTVNRIVDHTVNRTVTQSQISSIYVTASTSHVNTVTVTSNVSCATETVTIPETVEPTPQYITQIETEYATALTSHVHTVTAVSNVPCSTETITTVSPTTVYTATTVTTVYVDNNVTVTVNGTDLTTNNLTVAVNVAPTATLTVTADCLTSTANELLTEYITQTSCITSGTTMSTSSVPMEVIKSVAEEIVKNLTVDAKSTSAYQRTLSSAEDHRRSSQYIGAFGIMSVLIPMAVVILADMSRILRDFRFGPGYKKRS